MGLSWIWVALLIFSLAFEIITRKYFALCIAVSSCLAIILHFCKLEFVWQAVAVGALSAVLVLTRFFVIPLIFHSHTSSISFESVVGERCVVVEKIDNFAGCGLVKIHGNCFSARGTEDNDTFEVGETLQLVAIEGVKLICRK